MHAPDMQRTLYGGHIGSACLLTLTAKPGWSTHSLLLPACN